MHLHNVRFTQVIAIGFLMALTSACSTISGTSPRLADAKVFAVDEAAIAQIVADYSRVALLDPTQATQEDVMAQVTLLANLRETLGSGVNDEVAFIVENSLEAHFEQLQQITADNIAERKSQLAMDEQQFAELAISEDDTQYEAITAALEDERDTLKRLEAKWESATFEATYLPFIYGIFTDYTSAAASIIVADLANEQFNLPSSGAYQFSDDYRYYFVFTQRDLALNIVDTENFTESNKTSLDRGEFTPTALTMMVTAGLINEQSTGE
uniref:hypothetical protein n=1 Tax=Thaumasiovibrio occultus TaxID=1891184 RepID=UPI000B359824|nr:hypothetical protein [Thaumasiovibrio occultus]